jgi:hypothetical protein
MRIGFPGEQLGLAFLWLGWQISPTGEPEEVSRMPADYIKKER